MFKTIFNKLTNIFVKENYNMGLYAPQWLGHFFFGKGEDITLPSDHPMVRWEMSKMQDILYSFGKVEVGRVGNTAADTVRGFYWCVGTYGWRVVEDLGTHWRVECFDLYDFHREGDKGTWKFTFPISAKKWMETLKPVTPFKYWFEPMYKPTYSKVVEVDEEMSLTHFNVCFVETDLNKLGKSFYTKWEIKIEKQPDRYWGDDEGIENYNYDEENIEYVD